jgi:prepilin peptidase CpaA
MDVAGWAVLVVAAVACVTDIRTRRVPNGLTFCAAAAGVAFSLLAAGWPGAGMSVAGWLVGCAIFLPFFALGGMGGGDVKLLAAIGAWLGPTAVVWVALYTALAGGVMALAVSLITGYVRQSFVNLWGLLIFWRIAGIQPMPGLTLRTSGSPRLPYALAIGAGTVAALWLQ